MPTAFSLNTNTVLFGGPKYVKIQYKAPDILKKFQVQINNSNLISTFIYLFFIFSCVNKYTIFL